MSYELEHHSNVRMKNKRKMQYKKQFELLCNNISVTTTFPCLILRYFNLLLLYFEIQSDAFHTCTTKSSLYPWRKKFVISIFLHIHGEIY